MTDDGGVNHVALANAAHRQGVLAVVEGGVVVDGKQVAAEDRLCVGNLQVDLGNALILGVVIRNAELIGAAGIGR